MAFNYAVSDAIGRAQRAQSILYRYDHYQHPESPRNDRVRNEARMTIDPSYRQLKHAVSQARWEGIPRHNAMQADRAAELIGRATWSLSHRPRSGRPANVRAAEHQIREAINLLYRARW